MNLRSLISVGKEVERAQEAAFELWMWLPSCKVARKNHGDYYAEVTPTFTDVMVEATMYIIATKNPDKVLTDEEKEWFERCPCGEVHKS